MSKKYFYLSIFFLISFSFLLSSNFSFARELEATYPPIPGAEMTERSTFPDYLKYLYTLGMAIAGIVALLAVVIGGFRYLTSAGSSEAMGDAKRRIIGGILGLVLLLSSYLILEYINPNLKNLEQVRLEPVPGLLVLKSTLTEGRMDFPLNFLQIIDNLPRQWKEGGYLSYECEKKLPMRCLFFIYDQEKQKCTDELKRWVVDLACGQSTELPNSGCAICQQRTPGITLYGATTLPFYITYEKSQNFSENFIQKASSVEITNDIRDFDDKYNLNNIFYGAILHTGFNYQGQCKYIHTTSPETKQPDSATDKMVNIEPIYSSISIYKYNQNWAPKQAPGTSEEDRYGVCFYYYDNYDATKWTEEWGGQVGYLCIPDWAMAPYFTANLEDLYFTWIYAPEVCWDFDSNPGSPTYGYCLNPPEANISLEPELFSSNIGSIKINGNSHGYWVVLFDEKQNNPGGPWPSFEYTVGNAETWTGNCQVFTEDVPNLKTEWALGGGKGLPQSVLIIPIRK